MKHKKRVFLFFFVMLLSVFSVSKVYCRYSNTYTKVVNLNIRKPNFTVIFNKNDPSGETVSGMMNSQTFTYGTATNLNNNAFTLTGFSFVHWNTAADDSGTSYSNGQSVSNLSSVDGAAIDLYAIWQANTYSVTLNANGGTVSGSPMSVTYHQAYGTLPTPVRSHYQFDGWYKESSFTNRVTASTIVNTAGNHTLYAKWTSLLLADYVSVGDKVNYPVNYSNVVLPVYDCTSSTSCTKSSTTYTPKSTYTGWRVLSIEGSGDNKYVRLVSSGIPLSYVLPTKHLSLNASTAVTNLTTSFFSTTITSTATPINNYNRFRECGFKKADGTAVTTKAQLKTLFNNSYTQVVSGTPQVQSMTKADIDAVWGSTTSNATYLTSNDLLVVLSTTSNTYAPYYVATANATSYLWSVYRSGAIIYTDKVQGVRVVVSLTNEVEKTGKTNNVWQIQ